jgi:integrase
MASISQLKGGLKLVQVYDGTGERRTVRIGKVSMNDAKKISTKIEELNTAKINGTPLPVEVATWLAERPAKFYRRLVKVGLVAPRPQAPDAPSATLGPFLDGYIGKRSDVKGGTTTTYRHTKRNLIEYFGADRVLAEITPADADQWRIWLAKHEITRKGKKVTIRLATETVNRRCKMAKQFFRSAVRQRLIPESPFEDMKGCSSKGNKAREYFVSRDEAQKVIDACPDAQWRLLFALSRYGGCRCPSEHLAIRWAEVDWENGRFIVHSSKTEHHEDKEFRVVPIFPELRPYLEDAYELAAPGTEFVITRYRDTNSNLRTQLERIIRKAGLEPWPKLFQNLRATRETELAEQFPIHVVCEWIGNNEAVAREHYLQTTEAHFERATGPRPEQPPKKALRKALRQNTISDSTPSHRVTKPIVFLEGNANLLYSATSGVGPEGFEPPTKGL